MQGQGGRSLCSQPLNRSQSKARQKLRKACLEQSPPAPSLHPHSRVVVLGYLRPSPPSPPPALVQGIPLECK
ncbi:hypothetical protein FRC15_008905 [Serendipita sp. 397]|nr:hypothetical protein FRC15_008905 [Serendipita sp. 397]